MPNLSDIFITKLKSNGIEDEITLLKVIYAIAVLRNEGLKFILLLIFYVLIHRSYLFFFCAVILLPVRGFSGGLHMKTNVTCFLFSFTFFFLSTNILPRLKLDELYYFSLLAISVLCIWLFSPVATSKRPVKTRKKYIRCKYKAIGMSLIACMVLVYLHNKPIYFHSGVWVLFLQSIQLVIAFILQKGGTDDEKA